MDNRKRARQFLPFNGLKGYGELLTEAREEEEEEQPLSEDRAQKLDDILGHLRKGDHLRLTFYESGRYRTLEGMLESIDRPWHFLRLGGKNYQVGREKNDCGSSPFHPALPTKAVPLPESCSGKKGNRGLSLYQEYPLPFPLTRVLLCSHDPIDRSMAFNRYSTIKRKEPICRLSLP